MVFIILTAPPVLYTIFFFFDKSISSYFTLFLENILFLIEIFLIFLIARAPPFKSALLYVNVFSIIFKDYP